MENQLQLGIALATQGEYEQAIAIFDQAISINSECAEAYYHRGLAYDELGKVDKAIADYDRSLSLDNQQVDIYLSRATAFLAQDNVQGCIVDLQIVFTLDPSCDKAYKLRANVCIRLKEYNQAIDYLKQAGKIYLARQDKESCRFCIARIRQIEQQKIAEQGGVTNQVFLQQIEQKISQGYLAEAYRDCSWLIQLDPYNGVAYQCRGKINQKLGEYPQARKDLLQAAKCFRTQGNIAAAERLERSSLELQLEIFQSPTENVVRLQRAPHPQNAIQNRLYLLVGNWNIAQSLVERVMLRYPGKPETWYWSKAIEEIESDRS